MAYFKHFDLIKYNGVDTVNILNSIIARYRSFRTSSLYYYYTLLDGEKAEDVCYRIYENTEYHWIILAINNIVDPYHDWMMGSQELEAFMESKYGDDLYDVHHFIDVTDGSTEDGYHSTKWQERLDNNEQLPHDIRPITNREYEITENETKRNVKVISHKFIDGIQREFEELMTARTIL